MMDKNYLFNTKNIKFHHLRDPTKLESILKYGILSRRMMKKKGIEIPDGHRPVAQNEYGHDKISILVTDDPKTDFEKEYEKEYKDMIDGEKFFPRNIPLGTEQRREFIYTFLPREGDDFIAFILSPDIKTIPKEKSPYSHLVKDKIPPEKILAICISKTFEGGFLKKEVGKKIKAKIKILCEKYGKPLLEV